MLDKDLGQIVATAIRSIVADLGGFSLFSWFFFIISACSGGDYSNIWVAGRFIRAKACFTFGVLVFLIGSVFVDLPRQWKRGMLPQGVLHIMSSGLAIALQYVFWGLFIMAILSFILIRFFPAKARD